MCITGGLTLKQEHYEATGKNLSKRALQDLMVLSKKEEFPWLKDPVSIHGKIKLVFLQITDEHAEGMDFPDALLVF